MNAPVVESCHLAEEFSRMGRLGYLASNRSMFGISAPLLGLLAHLSSQSSLESSTGGLGLGI